MKVILYSEDGKIASSENWPDDMDCFPEVIRFEGRLFLYRGWSKKTIAYTEVKPAEFPVKRRDVK